MISPETGINFIKALCNKKDDQLVNEVNDKYELRMILNANPISRSKVE
jgi:hypothetical protein